ncbi:hypothetical protein Btru_021502 [Bulinus truncatus]|nr:hypothetical protein Btru_021502 [Bulinus truncatus]
MYTYLLLAITASCFATTVLYRPHKTISLSGCRGALVAGKDKVVLLGRITNARSTWVHGEKFGFDIFTNADRVHRCLGSLKSCGRHQDR